MNPLRLALVPLVLLTSLAAGQQGGPFLNTSRELDLGAAGSAVKLRVGGARLVTSAAVNVFLRPSQWVTLDNTVARAILGLFASSIALQVFSGTGETLRDCNVRRTVFRVDFATVR